MFILFYAFFRFLTFVIVGTVKLMVWATVATVTLAIATCAAISSAAANRRYRVR